MTRTTAAHHTNQRERGGGRASGGVGEEVRRFTGYCLLAELGVGGVAVVVVVVVVWCWRC